MDSSHIECVQRRFLCSASFILNIDNNPLDYQPVMLKLGLVHLVDRRVEADLLSSNKLIDGRIDAPTLLS